MIHSISEGNSQNPHYPPIEQGNDGQLDSLAIQILQKEQGSRELPPKRIAVIRDTDQGTDPDDLISQEMGRNCPGYQVHLIISADEEMGKRAQMIRTTTAHYFPKVAVAQGLSLNTEKKYFVCDELIDATLNQKEAKEKVDFREAIFRVIEENDVVHFVGIGAMTNLAAFLEKYPLDQYPQIKKKMKAFLMGGSVDFPERPREFNIKRDIAAARKVLTSGLDIHLITLNATLHPLLRITREHPLMEKIAINAPHFFRYLAHNLEKFAKFTGYPDTRMHDPLAESVALGEQFVDFYSSAVKVLEDGQIVRCEEGFPIQISRPLVDEKAKAFMDFLESKVAAPHI